MQNNKWYNQTNSDAESNYKRLSQQQPLISIRLVNNTFFVNAMDKIMKLFTLLFALNLMTPANAQISVRFDNDCLFVNSIEFGRAIMETIGESATRRLIENNQKIKVSIKIDSLGRVKKILRSDFKCLTKKESVCLTLDILSKRHFYLCYIDGQNQEDRITKELRNEFRKDYSLSLFLIFPGQFHEKYIRYKGKLTKADYIIEKVKGNK